MFSALRDQLDAGLPGFRGTRIAARIPLRQQVLHEMFSRNAAASQIELQDGDVVMVRIFGIPLKATILGAELPLRVVLRIPYAVRMALWPFQSRLPFIEFKGSQLTVDLAALAASKYPAYAEITRYLRLHDVRVSHGLLLASVEFVV